jgi:CRISPR-associated protein Cas2
MVVMILQSVTPGLRGELTRWLIEPHAGVFVGSLSALVRDKLWELVCSRMAKRSGAILIYGAANEQGYAMRNHGETSRTLEDFDGLTLIRIGLSNSSPAVPGT